jgi:cysteine-rich repeat protein
MFRSAPWLLLTLVAACSIPEFQYPPAPPRIARFTVTPFEPGPGEEVLLHYEVEGSTQRVLGGGPTDPLPLPEAQGTISLLADQDRTLILEATGPGGTTVAQTAFRLSDLAPVRIVAFEVVPTRTYPGALARVAWRTQNARRVTIEADDGTLLYAGTMPDGTLAVPVGERNLTLHLRADGDQGPVTAEATVTIEPRLPLILNFEATPATLAAGEDLTLRWETGSARRVVLLEETPAGPVPPLEVSDFGNLLLRPSPGLHRFRLRAENEVGTTEEALTVWVVNQAAPEILEFTATPTVAGYGGDVALSWRIVPNLGDPNVSAELDLGPQFIPQPVDLAGSRFVQVERTTVLTLSVWRFGAVVDTAQLNVALDPALPRLTANINTTNFRPGEPVGLVADFSNADVVRVVDGSGQLIATTTISPLLAQTPAVRSTTYHVSAENSRGATTRHFPVYVGEPPAIPTLTVDDPFIRRFRSTCFQWVAPGADSAELAVGFLTYGRSPPIGSACGRISDSSGYATLTAYNLSGSNSQSVSFQVGPESNNATDEEPNDTPATAMGPYSAGPIGINGSIEIAGQDVYAWEGRLEDRVIGSTTPASCDQPIEVEVREDRIDPRNARRVVIPAGGGCPAIDARLTPGLADLEPPYLIVLRRPSGLVGPANYFLVLNSEARTCGDGVVDFREDCDDGASRSGDGCSNACYFENAENEPNIVNPTPLTIGDTIDGYLAPGDEDNFQLQIDPFDAGPYRLTVAPSTAEGLAVELSVFDSTRGYFLFGAPLDSSGGASIEPSALYLEAGPYLITLRAPDQNVLPSRGPYRITLTAE